MVTEFTFTPTGGRPIVFAAVTMSCYDGSNAPCVSAELATTLLDAWKSVSEDTRKFLWPTVAGDDDECTLAYSARDTVHMGSWSTANEENLYALDQLSLLLPADQFTLKASVDA